MQKHFLLCASVMIAASSSADTGRQLQILVDNGVTTNLPSRDNLPFRTQAFVAEFWDERCAKIDYVINSSVRPNEGQPDEISPEELTEVMQKSMDAWNDNPSSYIEMNVARTEELGQVPRIAGDFTNEISFFVPRDLSVPAAVSASTTLTEDTTFVAGADIDGDGDADVYSPESANKNVCFDIDNDGDIEFPAGDYKAGTIIDNDLVFNRRARWELDATDDPASDLMATAVHELGHSHGISHSIINQISRADGSGSTMWPFGDADDGADELAQRTLHVDDLAASAFAYPEGSSEQGIAALQEGDIAFDEAYDVLEGSVNNIMLDPETFEPSRQAASAVAVTAKAMDGSVVSFTTSGQVVLFENEDFEFLQRTPESFISDRFRLPVPANRRYTVHIEPIDGTPLFGGQINLTGQVANIYGFQDFTDEAYNGRDEADGFEFLPAQATPVVSNGSKAKSIDITTNLEIQLRNHISPIVGDDAPFISNSFVSDFYVGVDSIKYVEKFDRAQIRSFMAGGLSPLGFSFLTTSFDDSINAIYSRVYLAIGIINDEGNVELQDVIDEQEDFLAKQSDFSPVYFRRPWSLPYKITRAFNADPNAQLFAVMEAENQKIGPSGTPAATVALQVFEPVLEPTSFISINEGPIEPLEEDTRYIADLNFTFNEEPVKEFLLNSATLDE